MDKSEQMFSLMSEYDQGHLDRKHFCKSKGISLAKFGYWRTKWLQNQEKVEPSEQPSGKFATFSHSPSSGLSGNCELIYPNGVRLRLPEVNISVLKALIDV